MPRKARWYRALPVATTVIPCGGEDHRVTWRRGKLVLENHDLAAERALLAFGGELCPCMRVLEIWVEQFHMVPDLFLQMHSWLGESAFLVPVELELPRRLSMLLSWERSWRFEAWLETRQAKLLEGELTERALPHLRRHLNAWKARTGARVVAGCRVGLIPSNQPASLVGATDGVAMRAEGLLPARWVVDVWARGVATVDDAFVLTLVEVPAPDHLLVRANRWEPSGARTWASVDAPARLRRRPGGSEGPEPAWHVTWEDG
jgi:hypothetical protein